MYTKRGNVKITKIISDLRDAVVDLKKVVLFEYEMPLLLRAQERPATLILTVISGFRITRACHVYNREAETGN